MTMKIHTARGLAVAALTHIAAVAPDTLADPGTNLLLNPSFEQGAALSNETSLPGWELSFRQKAESPPLGADEVRVVDDPAQAHSGRQFLRMTPRSRTLAVQSPVFSRFEPGLYEVSVWARGRPQTIVAPGLAILGAGFGAGFSGLNESWQKFSRVVACKGISDPGPWPDQARLGVAVFAPGERGQIPDPMLDIDDASVTRLTAGLADVFSDHMVLQRERPVPVWGWARDPGQRVSVTFNGQTRTATADQDGRWKVVFEPMQAGGPYVLTLDGRAAAYDVMVGDVWICSGQSNMEFGIDKLHGIWGHAPEVIAQANQPLLRLWQAPKQFSASPMRAYLTRQSNPNENGDFQARWEACSPTTVARGIWGGFSAVGYFFGREIQTDQHVAVGLMMIANGGTEIESFISEEGLRPVPRDQWIVPPIAQAAKDDLKNPPPPRLPEGFEAHSAAYDESVASRTSPLGGPDGKAFHYASAAYNSLMAPVFPYAVRGVLWYQGEHNGNDRHYEAKLKALIADWRTRFGQPDMPFIIAQLPYWRAAQPAAWQLVREAQWHASQTVPRTALAVTLDLADEEGDGYGMGEIHPKRKREVGQRMALAARAVAYGEKLVSSGPIYRAMKVEKGCINLKFDSVGDGLEVRGAKLIGFQIAGSDRKFVVADAAVTGALVTVSSPAVPDPVAVRYGFVQSMLPTPNLYNREGLPAAPFRTDDWVVE